VREDSDEADAEAVKSVEEMKEFEDEMASLAKKEG
jgi:hypothetical protein